MNEPAWCVTCERMVPRTAWADHAVHRMRPARRLGQRYAAPIGDGGATVERRWKTGLDGLDRCLGGGIVPGTRILLTGDPGCGKSTLLLLALDAMAQRGARVLYLTGEESRQEVELRHRGMGLKPSPRMILCATTSWEVAAEAIHTARPSVIVLDSLRRFTTNTARGAAGDDRQVEALIAETAKVVRGGRCAMFVVNHVNADGVSYGRNDTIHDLTAYLHFQRSPRGHRVLTTRKNRHGPSGVTSVWEFPPESKRIREVADVNRALLSHLAQLPGGVVFATDSAALPLEASVSAPRSANEPRVRTHDGLPDAMLGDVLDRLADLGVKLADRSVRVQLGTSDGKPVDDPQLAAAVAAAVVSASEREPLGTVAAFGAFSAAGSIVADAQVEARLHALKGTGVEVVYGPPMHGLVPPVNSIRYVSVATLVDLVEHLQARAAKHRVDTHRQEPSRLTPRAVSTRATPTDDALTAP